MKRVDVKSPFSPKSERGAGFEVQVEEKMNAADFNAVRTHNNRGIGSRRPRTWL